jgi:transcriptional regulator with XRE-family HTH domain
VAARRVRDARGSAGAIEVGRRIATIRQRLGLSQVAFARQVGLSRNALVAYERGGRVPKSASLGRIAEAGGVSIDWLLGRDAGRATPNGRMRRDRAWESAIEALRALWLDPDAGVWAWRCFSPSLTRPGTGSAGDRDGKPRAPGKPGMIPTGRRSGAPSTSAGAIRLRAGSPSRGWPRSGSGRVAVAA